MQQPSLNEQELGLILDLLESERKALHPEVRRTGSPHVHEQLQERLKTVEALVERFRAAVGTVGPGE